MTMMTTVGFGDRTAQNQNEQMYATFAIFVVAMLYGMALGFFTTIIGRYYNDRQEEAEQRRTLTRYVAWREFTPHLREMLEKQMFDDGKQTISKLFQFEKKMLPDLNSTTRSAIHREIIRP